VGVRRHLAAAIDRVRARSIVDVRGARDTKRRLRARPNACSVLSTTTGNKVARDGTAHLIRPRHAPYQSNN